MSWRRAKSEPLLAAARSMVAVAAVAASEDRVRRMVAGTVVAGTARASLRVRTGVGRALTASDISEVRVRSNSDGTWLKERENANEGHAPLCAAATDEAVRVRLVFPRGLGVAASDRQRSSSDASGKVCWDAGASNLRGR